MLQLNTHTSWWNALTETLLATMFCMIAVGAAFLPSEYGRVSRAVVTRLFYCWPIHNGQAVMLVDKMGTDAAAGLLGKAIHWYSQGSSRSLPAPLELSNEAFCVAVNSDGTCIFVGYRNGTVERCLMGGCEPELATFGVVPGLRDIACAPNGGSLVAAGDRGLELWEIAPAGEVSLKSPRLLTPGTIDAVAVSPCSNFVLAGVNDAERSQLLEIDLRHGTVVPHLELAGRLGRIMITADGQHVALISTSGDIWLCQREPDSGAWQAVEGFGLRACTPRMASFSPDSSRLITCEKIGPLLQVWDLRAQRVLEPVTAPISVVQGCAFLDPQHVLLWGVNGNYTTDSFDGFDLQLQVISL